MLLSISFVNQVSFHSPAPISAVKVTSFLCARLSTGPHTVCPKTFIKRIVKTFLCLSDSMQRVSCSGGNRQGLTEQTVLPNGKPSIFYTPQGLPAHYQQSGTSVFVHIFTNGSQKFKICHFSQIVVSICLVISSVSATSCNKSFPLQFKATLHNF